MEYRRFQSEFKKQFPDYLPLEWETWEIQYYKRYKVNAELDAVTVMPPEGEENTDKDSIRAYPVFYLQDLYELHQAGNEIESILRYVSSIMQSAPGQDEIKKSGFQLDRLKDCIVFQMINYERNHEMLKELPHRRILDLAVIYRALLFDKDGRWGGIVVTDSVMKEWGMTEEDLYEIAYRHTPEAFPFRIRSMEEAVNEDDTLPLVHLQNPENRMYVITTDSFQFGADAFLYSEVMKQIAEQFEGEGFLLIPGSTHELYAVRSPLQHVDFWKNTLKYANQKLVKKDEWLSDNLYYYNAEKEMITLFR